ncbi:hypothetical protein AB6A40_001246 [Gnathostoma spinigerum]|uniref:MIF4G domain-containing protein n=1 Tax=Gnathostoma spinigerum TaxID=75299 RepID=A0ABD6ECX3_9BILA
MSQRNSASSFAVPPPQGYRAGLQINSNDCFNNRQPHFSQTASTLIPHSRPQAQVYSEFPSHIRPYSSSCVFSDFYSPPSSQLSAVSSHSFNPDAAPFQPAMLSQQAWNQETQMYDSCSQIGQYEDYSDLHRQPSLELFSYMDNLPNDAYAMSYESQFNGRSNTNGSTVQSSVHADRRQSPRAAALVEEVRVGLEQLMHEPHEFDTWSGAIRKRLIDPDMHYESLKLVVRDILHMAITEPRVHYNFSRLCALLGKDIKDFRGDCLLPVLRNVHFVERMQMTVEQQQNLLMFFAEIYDNYRSEKGAKLNCIGTAVMEQIKSLISGEKINDACIKTVLNSLKLTGRNLDSIHGGRESIDEIFTSLNAIANGHPKISGPVKDQIRALTSLRENHWEHVHLHATKQLAIPENGLTPSSSSGDIIGPDGQPLSDEERAFLEEHFEKLDNNDSTLDDSDVNEEYENFMTEVDRSGRNCGVVNPEDDSLTLEDLSINCVKEDISTTKANSDAHLEVEKN